jgi:hypothetical protein
MWLRMDAARKLAKALDLPVDKWWMAIAKEVEASGDTLEVLRRYLGGKRAEGGDPGARAARSKPHGG